MRHPEDYRDKEVVVLGLAKSGVAVAKLFHDFGAKVTVNDKKEREACPEAEELEALGISVVCGGHPDGLIHSGVSLVVKNPGIFYSAAPVVKAQELGIEVVTEVEVAYPICQAPIIGITGSNGKTTTTTWVGKILEAAGQKPIVAGNIGRPLCDAAREATPDNRLVVELSSFQLKGTSSFRPSIGVLLNLYETHLDYHGDMQDYISSKAKLFANQLETDTAVLNADNPLVRELAESANLKAKLLWFSSKGELPSGVYLHNDTLMYRDEAGSTVSILPAGKLGIPGKHNIENALAAAAISIASGASIPSIAEGLATFRGVEHRLEYVSTVKGIPYYNDSKATNPSATFKAMEAFDSKLVLIAGGLDRGMDYLDMLPYFRDRVSAIVTLGETRVKLNGVAEQAGVPVIRTVERTDDAALAMQEAVQLASAAASPGEVVLLSPACASWDMFPSFEERGRMFKQAVHTL
ncbi:UDP-N-acetylmuramoyl-L-alanine--D-glutamate ligase [Paenibacillus aurantius]|uniref:UDP-N-acetylmuramoylalanine--D-glutamate ligase n=1 Tax=Paenibacillus aurantius TaxID=2918900 RepID=A0AA96LJZ2_9BACL|nr:UDP-N-acetylmuramoyl-L-alanine--D-glutamate ligase [Paenibacillus aurantius]WNQ13516.1 UDP-N-acetylmuramoyl-L-alanine--D-glutamate ligase [Paenibacillus aurantius]